MFDAASDVPKPANEPVLSYAPGTTERDSLEKELKRLGSGVEEIPLMIGGREVKTGDVAEVVCPHDHGHVLARYHRAGPEHAEMAVEAAMDAWKEWSETDPDQRFAVFLRAAELLSGP